MAEAGTLIAIVQLADRVVGLCSYWIEAVRDAPATLRSILLETSMLQTIFNHIEFLTSCDNTASAAFSSLSKPDGPLEHCHRILTSLIDLFPDGGIFTSHASSSTREKVTVMAARLAWPFKEPKARKLLEEMSRYKAAITLALTAESTQDVKDIKEKVRGVYDMLTESQRNEFCRWLQSTDPSPLHNRSRKLVEDGTCNWMLRLPQWADWIAAKYRCLWIHGIPGAGKTVLASYLVDTVASHCHDELGPKCAALYYYCYFGHNQDESAPLLRWIVTQLCRQAEAVPAEAYAVFKQRCEPSLPKLLDALATILDGFQTVYVIVDAVDESKPRGDLLKTLRDLSTDPRFSKIQLLVTSREYIDIERVLDEISKPVSMSNSFVERDILLYVRSSVQNNPKFRRWSSQIRGEVQTTLSTRANGMFRWVVCQLDRLQRLKGEPRIIRHALATLPRTLDETYERIFLEIPDEERSFVRQCLRWIHFHDQQYNDNIPIAILLQALESRNDKPREPEDECPYDEQDLKELCGCLVQVSPGYGFKICDDVGELIHEASRVVSFAHYTVREFLDSDRISTSPVAFFNLEKQMQLDIQRTILLTALEFRESDFENLDPEDDCEDLQFKVFHNLTNNFRSYCAVSAIFSISSHLSEIISHQDLRDHLFDMLNPAGVSAASVMPFLELCEDSLSLIAESIPMNDLSIFRFTSVHWRSIDKPSQAVECAIFLFSILLLTDSFEPLAKELFRKIGRSLDFMHTPLQFEMDLIDAGYNTIWCEFDGRMVEFFAQVQEYDDGKRLNFILDQGATLHNPTEVLCSYIGRCRVVEDRYLSNPALLNRILEHGCDLNGEGYTVTPLQIAVAVFDFTAVETLLRAGADPNKLGDPDGVRWSGIFDSFEHLEGLSALLICQDRSTQAQSDDERKMLEALLVQHGAESFTIV